MREIGYIKMARKSLTNAWLLTENEERNRFTAWFDLVALASWDNYSGSPHLQVGKGDDEETERGEVIASLGALAKRWNWSKKRVRYFLQTAERKGMVELTRGPTNTRIRIKKYNHYQGDPEPVAEAPKAKKAKKAKAKVAIETDDERRVWEEIERTRKIGYERLGRKPGNYTIDASRIRLVKTKLEEYGIDMVLDACRGAAISTYHAAFGEKEGQPIKLMPENILGKTAKINQLEVCAEIWENRRRKQRPKRAEESFRSLVEVTQGMEADA
jgi:hypothetical protein